LDAGILNVEIHSLATPKDNRIMEILCKEINNTQILYPRTKMRLVFNPVSL
jgi:hypothetical protein